MRGKGFQFNWLFGQPPDCQSDVGEVNGTASTERGSNMSDSEHMFRYWVELRDLRDGSLRTLPLHAATHVHIPTKKGEQQRPGHERLQLEDGSSPFEASTFEELVVRLAIKYPDHLYERTLRRERDFQAEHAMDELARLIARAAVEKWVRECELLKAFSIS